MAEKKEKKKQENKTAKPAGKKQEKKEEPKAGKKEEHAKKPEEKKTVPAEKKKKKIVFEKWSKPGKEKEIKALRDSAKKRARRLFRGRFGQRNWVRNIRKEKWQRWRIARGIDVSYRKDDGLVVKAGYRSPLEIRGRHPSGFKEVLVRNLQELEIASKDRHNAVKFAGTLGMRKRDELMKKANQLKIWVLNP
ncbi:MAG: eL32 family ribosomal protein [Candidatus ainarchaeum sp.]|nr:eL32 family ribosomal protein [Candidatus ainarchaeum sp.]